MYERTNTLISRPGYSGFGDIWDSISGAAGSIVKAYGQSQQAAGAAAASAQTNRDLAAALAAQRSGPDMTTIMLLGGAGLVAFMLLRKKG